MKDKNYRRAQREAFQNGKMATKTDKKSFWEQFDSLRNVPRFFKMIWTVSPGLTLWNIVLRLVQSAVPLLMLYVGKEIVDEVVPLIAQYQKGALSFEKWWYFPVWMWVGLEFLLAIANSLLSRAIVLTDSLLGDMVNNDSSVRIIRHAATLDLYQFEDANFYDKLERARTQTSGRTALMSMVLGQGQDLITVLFLGAGLVAFNPWLLLILVVAVIPSFVGESKFNQESYSLSRSWTPERREIDYLRYIGASNETAKEIKIFGLENFIADRFKSISDKYFRANRKLALKRAAWGSLFSTLGTASYYAAYVFVIWQTIVGIITYSVCGSFVRGGFVWNNDDGGTLHDLYDYLAAQNTPGIESFASPYPEYPVPRLGWANDISPDGLHLVGVGGPFTTIGPGWQVDLNGGGCVAPFRTNRTSD